MALLYFQHDSRSYYISDGYWCAENWIMVCNDDEMIFGISYNRRDILDKTLLARIRKQLRILGIHGTTAYGLYRDTRVFRTQKEGGVGFDYFTLKTGICNLKVTKGLTVDLMKYLDHGQVVSGDWKAQNHIVYGGTQDVRSKDSSKDD